MFQRVTLVLNVDAAASTPPRAASRSTGKAYFKTDTVLCGTRLSGRDLNIATLVLLTVLTWKYSRLLDRSLEQAIITAH